MLPAAICGQEISFSCRIRLKSNIGGSEFALLVLRYMRDYVEFEFGGSFKL